MRTIPNIIKIVSVLALVSCASAADVTQQELAIINPASGAKLWASVHYPADASAVKKCPAVPDEPEARQNLQSLRRHLDLFKRLGIKASYWFTGLAAEQIQRLDPEFLRLLIGPKGNTGGSTEAGWFLGMMGMPDARSIAPETLRRAATGEFDLFRSIEDFVARPASNEIQSVAVLVHDTDFVRGPPDLRQRLWETYEKLVRWAAQHPRLKVVTFEEILGQIADDRVKTISRDELGRAAQAVAASPAAPPDYVDLGGDYLSLADTFQAFAQALRAFAESGKLPASVTTADLLGPTEAFASGLPSVTAAAARPKATGEEVVAAAQQICAGMTDRIPARIAVGIQKLNPAEFLFAMAQTVNAIAKDGKPAPLSLHAVDLLPSSVRENRLADPLTKLQFWTYKPERWKTVVAAPETQPQAENWNSEIKHQKLPATFFAVHCEAGSANPPMWDALTRFVEMADRYSAKLTLMFNPQWAEFIVPDTARFARVKAWQKAGHEVAVHYHNVVHGNWCGYTNRKDDSYTHDARYRGTVPEMMKLLRQLAAPDTR